MLKLNLSPIRSDEERPLVKWEAPFLYLDEVPYDLSMLPGGAWAQHPMLGQVSRSGDDYEVTITLTHGPNAPHETRFPQPITVTENGPIELPPYDAPEADNELAE